MVQKTESQVKASGVIAFFGFMFLLAYITMTSSVHYSDVIDNIWNFLRGGYQQVPDGSLESSISIFLHVGEVTFIGICVAMIFGLVNRVLLGPARSDLLSVMEKAIARGPFYFFCTIFGEEVIARLIPLGLLTKVFPGPTAFYVLFFLGNFFWAILHFFNYEDKSDRSILRVLPQFVAGLLDGYLFVRYGFWITLMAHLFYDVILLSVLKKQEVTSNNVRILFYYVIVACVSGLILVTNHLSLAVFTPWIAGQTSPFLLTNMFFHGVRQIMPLPGLTFTDYLVLLIFFDALLEILTGVLLLDRGKIEEKYVRPQVILCDFVLYIAMVIGVNAVVSIWVQDAFIRALIVTLVITLTGRTTTGSMMARSWLIGSLSLFLIIAYVSVLGFWNTLLILIIMQIIGFVPTLELMEDSTVEYPYAMS